MGIDFSHCGAHWSYSGFNAFRRRLANEIGMNLDEMIGFGGDRAWEEFDDPILPLLNHSDCDGILTPEECGLIYLRLIELVSRWKKNDYDRLSGEELASGMKSAAMNNEEFQFC
jgi:hypothetical protein